VIGIGQQNSVDQTHYGVAELLRLNWTSRCWWGLGDEPKIRARYGTAEFTGANLYLWCYSDTELSADDRH